MIRIILFTFFIISSNLFGGLLKPEDGDELNYIHVLFEWEQEPDAVAYQIEISSDHDLIGNCIRFLFPFKEDMYII
jgi:hypothetical protein